MSRELLKRALDNLDANDDISNECLTLITDLRGGLEELDKSTAFKKVKSNYEKLYEELRQVIDGNSESMTHEDAVSAVKFWQREPETFRGEDVDKPFSDSTILALHAKLSQSSRAKQFTNEHWFIAGFTMAESAHRIEKEIK